MTAAIIKMFRRLHWRLPFCRTKFSGEMRCRRVILDYAEIADAAFVGCEVWYGGGSVSCNGVRFDKCTWHVYGEAANTLALLQAMNAMGGAETICKTFGLEQPK